MATLAGCLGADGVEPTEQAPGTDGAGVGPDGIGAQAPPTWSLVWCHQLHLSFPAMAENFEPVVPDGFTNVSEDPAGLTTNLLIIASRCSSGVTDEGTVLEEVHDVVVELHVQPPAELDDELPDALVIERYTDAPDLLGFLAARGLSAAATEAEIMIDRQQAAAGSTSTVRVTAGELTYQLDTALTPSEGTFEASQMRVWMTDEQGELAGSLVRNSTAAANLGIGTVGFQATGAQGAPPVTAGAAHEVTELSMTLHAAAVLP